MAYTIRISREAQDELKHLDRKVARRISRRITWLATNAETARHYALAGQWQGLYRWRLGDYRIIYALNREKRIVVIVKIGHRRDVYNL